MFVRGVIFQILIVLEVFVFLLSSVSSVGSMSGDMLFVTILCFFCSFYVALSPDVSSGEPPSAPRAPPLAGARRLLELGGSPFEGDRERLRQFAGVIEGSGLLSVQP